MLNRRAGKALMLLSALLCLLLTLPTAMADSKARIVRLSYVDGNVQIDRGEGPGYEKAIMNMPVIQGAKVSTGNAGARAEIELEDGSAIRLAPESIVAFPELGLRDSGHRLTSVELQKGTAYFSIHKHAGEFSVTVGGKQLEIHDNSEFRVSAMPQRIELAVYKGDVKANTSKEVDLKKNETLGLDVADNSQWTVAKGISPEPYDDWNQQRERYRDLYASASYTGGYSGFSSAYSYGYADLNYYGNYFYAPGWGLMWQPFGIGPGWSPFMDGAWMWYPGPGYMWVSSYPWGWMPYRYGAWNFVPGFGWAWCPGRTWSNWSAYTPVRTAPVGYVPPQPPTANGGVHQTALVGTGGKTIYPATLGKPGSLLLNRDAVMGANVRGTVITPSGKAIRPVTGATVMMPTTTTHGTGGKVGASTGTGSAGAHVSSGSTGGMHTSSGSGGAHSSSGTSGGHSGGGGHGR
jgi:hypothetical protein